METKMVDSMAEALDMPRGDTLSLLDLTRAYDDARAIVNTITIQAAGTGVWDKLDRIRQYIGKQARQYAETFMADAEQSEVR